MLLGVVSAAVFSYTLWKAESRPRVLAFFCAVFGVTLYIETTILIFLRAYNYYPMILPKNILPFDDMLTGNLFSQFSISAAILLVVTRKWKSYWYLIFAAVFGLIEELFLRLGIYSHNWYRTWMTIVLLPILFWILSKLYCRLEKGMKPVGYYILMLLGLFPLVIIIYIWPLMLIGLQDFSFHVLPDFIMSRYGLVLVLFLALALSMMFVHFSRVRLWCKALIVAVDFTLYYLAWRLGYVVTAHGLFLPVAVVTMAWVWVSVRVLDWGLGGILDETCPRA